MHTELQKLASLEPASFELGHPNLSFHLAATLPVDLDFKQTLLEIRSERERLMVLLDHYAKIIPKLQAMTFGRQKAGGNGWIH